jgi:hypothetical protein
MPRRAIGAYTRDEFDALRARLESARDVLRGGGALLQSVARAYYVLYALASFLAGKYDVYAIRVHERQSTTDQRFSHTDLPALVYTLYSGNKKDAVQSAGSTPGVVSGTYDEHSAYRKSDNLMRLRVLADYGPTDVAEPLTIAQTDASLAIARKIVTDLETLL